MHAFFDLRAELMLSLMGATLGAEAILSIARGYIDQAVQLHECLWIADNLMDDRRRCADSVTTARIKPWRKSQHAWHWLAPSSLPSSMAWNGHGTLPNDSGVLQLRTIRRGSALHQHDRSANG
jgi:hypothetical protein